MMNLKELSKVNKLNDKRELIIEANERLDELCLFILSRKKNLSNSLTIAIEKEIEIKEKHITGRLPDIINSIKEEFNERFEDFTINLNDVDIISIIKFIIKYNNSKLKNIDKQLKSLGIDLSDE